jgi:signal transduction histidine kinase
MTEHEIAELELFAGRLAHDVRGPLSSVALAVTLSQERISDEKSKELLARAHRTVMQISELMEGLLLLARLVRSNHPGSAQVAEVLLDVLENFRPIAEAKQVDLNLGEIVSCSVACSAGVLTNMIANLLDNAIKYMGDAAVRSVRLSAVDCGKRVRVQVEDTGPGVPVAAQARIFDLYARANQTDVVGLGLGLATVKRLAEVLGGTTGMRPRQSCGSLFWVELPKVQSTTVVVHGASTGSAR